MWRRWGPAWLALVLGGAAFVLFSVESWPGRVIAYLALLIWLGGWLYFYMRKIERLRDEARAVLGDRFDDAGFDRMLKARTFGETLAYSVDQWVAARKKDG